MPTIGKRGARDTCTDMIDGLFHKILLQPNPDRNKYLQLRQIRKSDEKSQSFK